MSQAPFPLLVLLCCLSWQGSAQHVADHSLPEAQDLSALRLVVSLSRLGPARRHVLASHSLPGSMQQQHAAAAAGRRQEPGWEKRTRAQVPSAVKEEEHRQRLQLAVERRRLEVSGGWCTGAPSCPVPVICQ